MCQTIFHPRQSSKRNSSLGVIKVISFCTFNILKRREIQFIENSKHSGTKKFFRSGMFSDFSGFCSNTFFFTVYQKIEDAPRRSCLIAIKISGYEEQNRDKLPPTFGLYFQYSVTVAITLS